MKALNPSKAQNPWPFLITYTVPLLALWGYFQGGLFNFAVPLYIFGLVPFLDLLLGTYTYNPTERETADLSKRWGFQAVAWPHVPLLLGLVIWGAWTVTQPGLSTLETVGLTLSIGICTGGIGINLAHELIHKRSRHERLMGQILLMNVSYMHFYIEHLLGHHRKVSTFEDAASSRKGESLYHFYFRTVVGSYRSAWEIETRRLQKKDLAIWGRHNRMLWFVLWPALYAGLLTCAFGWGALAFFAAQSVVAFSMLEIVNYVEHYGLERQKNDKGHYEKVDVVHSWNANQILTNAMLFNLQRHSDHHAHQSRRYQILRQFEKSPQLPTGYAGMMLLSFIPPLWFRVMDPRVEAHMEPLRQPPLAPPSRLPRSLPVS